MAGYPGSEGERRIPEAALRQVTRAIYVGCGMDAADADLVAETLVHADLRGIHSHGVMRVPLYVDRLTRHGVDPRGRPRIAADLGAALHVDGGNAMGQVAAAFAMDRAVERARETGIAAAAVGGSNHCGAMDYYALRALSQDMIGIAMTHASPTMAAWGGADRILGINPMAIAVPSSGPAPLVLDTSFGATARGRIQVFHQKGIPLPEGWAFDKDGRPTTDTAAALEGLIAPAGGHKGSGLALMVGLLSSLLSGASFGTRLGNTDRPPVAGADGQLMLALNAGAFAPLAAIRERADAVVAEIRASRPAPGFDRVVPPGLPEHELEQEYRSRGIPLNEETIAGIRRCAAETGADASPLD